MIRVQVTMTGKGYSPKDAFRVIAEDEHTFPDMKAAHNWIKETYGKAKRAPRMYCDMKDGSTKKTGYVIGFRMEDISNCPVDKWIQQDWISFYECKPIYL